MKHVHEETVLLDMEQICRTVFLYSLPYFYKFFLIWRSLLPYNGASSS